MSSAIPEGRSQPGLGAQVETGGRAAFDAIVNALWEPIVRFFWRGLPAHDAVDDEELLGRQDDVRAPCLLSSSGKDLKSGIG